MSFTHFGVRVREHESNHINKATYLSAKPEYMPGWTEEHFARRRLKADLNYDLNMRFFSALDQSAFTDYIAEKCHKWPFTECFDLNEINGVPGIYMLVLDNFKQVYIGQSGDMCRRIRGHWSKKMSLERLICGRVWNSVLSINSFGALDTTRIFYIPLTECSNLNTLFVAEEVIVSDFSPQYTLNRTAGGIGTNMNYTDTATSALLAVAANLREKDFLPFLDINELKSVMTDTEYQDNIERFPQFAAWVAKQHP